MKSFEENILENRLKGAPVIVDLGCGSSKKVGTIGLDILKLPGVDYVVNLENGLSFIPDNSIDQYVTSHFLEHVENLEVLLKEVHRTLKPNGLIEIKVPHFSNPYYYSDYTHKRFFGLYSFDYFSKHQTGYRRKVPVYNSSFQFEVVRRKLIFKSPYLFFTNLIKKHFWTRVFNSSRLMQAIYEDSYSSILPCYELEFVLKALK